MPLVPGTRLGRYEVIALVATGGMGEVYRGRDTDLHRDVALKVLPAEKVSDPERLNRFVREARAASLLNHANIVTVHDIAHVDGVHFIVMEYVRGNDLSHHFPMDLATGLPVALQIASALAKTHAAGITHRDIKPANIMLTEDGTVKVLDFGIAKLNEPASARETRSLQLTEPNALIGTPAYMSPEQALGREVDIRSDIFSFGVLLYEMFSSRRAFARATPEASVRAILNESPSALRALVPQLPPELDAVITRCLEKDPSHRFHSMVDVRIALSNISSAVATNRKSIAVLPFVNMSADKENEYFSDGLSEEIISLLAQRRGIDVVARTSSFAFRGKCMQVCDIARQLAVTHVLEGSVRRAGDRIRVTAHLVNAADGLPFWSEQYNAEIADVFNVQQEIAGAIAKALEGKLGVGSTAFQPARPKPEAYNAYLTGRYHLHKLTPASLAKAKEAFESAIALEPRYAGAYSGLALYYAWCADAARDRGARSTALVRKALELDPALSEAHGLLGASLATFDYDWNGAEREFHLALTCAAVPSDVYYQYARCFLLPLGRYDEALRAVERAAELDPLVPTYLHAKAAIYSCMRDFPRMLEQSEATLQLDDRFWPAQLSRGWALLELGHLSEAMSIFEALQQQLGPEHGMVVQSILACLSRSGRDEEARALFDDAREHRHVAPWLLGSMSFELGDIEKAFDFIEQAFVEHDSRVIWFVTERRHDLGNHPRLRALRRKLNLPDPS